MLILFIYLFGFRINWVPILWTKVVNWKQRIGVYILWIEVHWKNLWIEKNCELEQNFIYFLLEVLQFEFLPNILLHN